MKYLFVTVKKVGKKLPTTAQYELYSLKVFRKISPSNQIQKEVYETDKHGRLHLHMILYVEDWFDWDNLKIYKNGWHVHTIEIDSHEDLCRISGYMDKDDGFKEWLKQLRSGEYLFQDKTVTLL